MHQNLNKSKNCISTGVYHFPKDEASRIALKTISSFLAQLCDQSLKVTIVCFDRDSASYSTFDTPTNIRIH